ncbi:MAG: HAD hydrolase-like protein [Alphaproteobacteria bacterium]|nr:HAD hydrolase-like protein [Alphaproteobacteria bacterium]
MPTLAFDTAWDAYLSAASRLPAAPPPIVPRRIASVAEIAGDFDLIILDAWGVLNLGETPIATARPTVDALRRLGKRLVVLSNDGSCDKPMAVAKYRRRGFDFAAEEIVTGIDLLAETLAALPPAPTLGLIADDPLPFPALTHPMLRLGDDAAAYERAAGFVFLSSEDWSERRQALLRASLAARSRPLVIGNPDIVSPGLDEIAIEPGYYAHRLAAELGIAPIFLGKPFAAVYRRVGALHPTIAPERILCVGDTPHTDVLGARAQGYRALLVEDGFCRGRDAAALCRACGIWPDFIAPRL